MWNQPGDPGDDQTGGEDVAPGAPPVAAPNPPRAVRRAPSSPLVAGLRLTLLLRQDLRRLPVSAGPFWIALLVSLASSLVFDYITATPPLKFSTDALQNTGFFFLVELFLCYVLARAAGSAVALWTLAALVTYGSIVPGALYSLVYTYVLGDNASWLKYELLFGAYCLWVAAMFWRALSGFGPGGSTARRAGLAVLAAACLGGGAYLLPSYGLWQTDYEALYKNEPPEKKLVAEDVLASQPQLLDQSLAAIAPSQPGAPHLYFLAYAPYATQEVFSREAHYTVHQFETRFAAQGRTLALINSTTQAGTQPLATVTNLRAALRDLGRKMVPDQDILFLFLTSHGSREGELAVDLPGVSLHALTAPQLSGLLDEAGIRWRVIVVSSCFSGTFVQPLQNEHTLIMTAARADRTSFGCSNEADFTYFGRAYFQQGLNRTASFIDAFGIARKLIDQWETEQKLEHAEPQIAVGSLIAAKLAQWQETLPAASRVAVPGQAQLPAPAATEAPSAAARTPAPATTATSSDSQAAQYEKTMRIYRRAAATQLLLSLVVGVVLLTVQWRAWLRFRHYSLALLTFASVGGLTAVAAQALGMSRPHGFGNSMGMYYGILAITGAYLLIGTWGSVALIRSYGRLAARLAEVETATGPDRPG